MRRSLRVAPALAGVFWRPGKAAFHGFAAGFRLLLDLAYASFVFPLYAYSRFPLDGNPLQYLESWAVFALVLFTLRPVLSRPSDYLLSSLFFAFVTPVTSYYGLTGASRGSFYLIVGTFLLTTLCATGPRIRVPAIRHGRTIAYVFCLAVVAATLLILVARGALGNINLNLADVYQYRERTSEIVGGGLAAYLLPWSTKVLNIYLLAINLWMRRWLHALVFFAIQVFFFAITGHKAILIYPLIVVFTWLYFSRTTSLTPLPAVLALVTAGALTLYLLFGEVWTASILTRRAFFVVARDAFDYFQFFSVGDHVFWSGSLLRQFLHYPYEVPPQALIGQWAGSQSWVNSGFIATGYMHAGTPGLVLYGVLAGGLLRLLDSLATPNVPTWFVISIVVVPFYSLISSSDLFTTLLTHGMGLGFALLILARNRGSQADDQQEINTVHEQVVDHQHP